jgi:hypothetical protein
MMEVEGSIIFLLAGVILKPGISIKRIIEYLYHIAKSLVLMIGLNIIVNYQGSLEYFRYSWPILQNSFIPKKSLLDLKCPPVIEYAFD